MNNQSSRILAASPEGIAKAIATLKQGDLVAIPTETVYGLAGRADNVAAIDLIYQAKGRPRINPLIIHVDSIDMAQLYAQFDARARAVAAAFWPGPLTIVLPLAPHGQSSIASNVTAGLDTIAVRCPAHPVMRDIIAGVNVPLAAPSANKSGFLSATRAIDVAQDFADSDQPALIIAAKGVDVGLESTILDLSADMPEILREGTIDADQIADILGVDVGVARAPEQGDEEEGGELSASPLTKSHIKSHIKSPGQLLAHYAPRLPMRLRAVDVRPDEALLAFGSVAFMAVVGGGRARDLPPETYRNLSESGDLQEAAANLYAMLHDLDKSGKVGIAVMDIPRVGVGLAINERLQRGAQSSAQKESEKTIKHKE